LSNGGGSVTLSNNDNQQLGITSTKGTITLVNGGSVRLADSSATNEIQTMSISAGKGQITLSNGGTVTLNDSSATNELQKLSLSKNGTMRTIALTQGDSVTFSVNDGDTTYWKKNSSGVYYAVGSVSIGTASADPSAALQVSSTTQGLLMPRMTEAQRVAISKPSIGLLVFQTNKTAGFYYYSGTAWVLLSSGSSGSSGSGSNNNTLIYTTDGF
jgi:hypothetical protein